MKLYAPPEVIATPCPTCGARAGFWCSPWKAHERRIRMHNEQGIAGCTTECAS